MNKKGLMAIGTMIIFIAVVLISAVASGLLIRSSGVLQQRALAVSDEARERIVTGLEIINVIAESELINETLNNFEVLTRLKAGSYPVQGMDVGLMLITSDYSTSAKLQHSNMAPTFETIDISAVPSSNDSSAWMTIPNMEADNPKDVGVKTEQVGLLINATGVNEALLFDLSFASNNPDPELLDYGYNVPGQIYSVDLGIDLSNITGAGQSVEIYDYPIKHPVSEDIYGFVTITGTATVNDSLSGLTAEVSAFPQNDDCDFDKLIPNDRFCVVTQVGDNDNTKMEKGELFSIRYKVKKPLAIGTEEIVNLRLVPKGGSIEEISAVTPMVFVLRKTNLWG